MTAAKTGGTREVLVNSMKLLYRARRNRGNLRLLSYILDMALANGPEVFRRQSLAPRLRGY